jgi:hypothetical protein
MIRRFSIRTLMAFIVLAAVGLAALKNAGEVWDGTILMAAMAAVGVAILAAIFSRGREQAWWIGFALFAGGYLHLAAGPWTVDAFRQRLVTTSLIGHLRNLMFESHEPYLLQERAEIRSQLEKLQPATRTYDPVSASLRNSLREIDAQLSRIRNTARHFDHFQGIGHSLLAFLAGLVGGVVAVWLRGRRDRGEAECQGKGSVMGGANG